MVTLTANRVRTIGAQGGETFIRLSIRRHGARTLNLPYKLLPIDGKIYAQRREDGKYIPVPPQKVERNRDNPDGRNHLCALPPNVYKPADTVYCFALGGAT